MEAITAPEGHMEEAAVEAAMTETEMVAEEEGATKTETEETIAETNEEVTEASTKLKAAGTKTEEIEIVEMTGSVAVKEEAEASKATVMAATKEAVALATSQANHSLPCQSTQRKLKSRSSSS